MWTVGVHWRTFLALVVSLTTVESVDLYMNISGDYYGSDATIVCWWLKYHRQTKVKTLTLEGPAGHPIFTWMYQYGTVDRLPDRHSATVFSNKTVTRFTVLIRNVKCRDAMTYKCQVKYVPHYHWNTQEELTRVQTRELNPRVQATVPRMLIVNPPSIYKDLAVEEGTKVTVHCRVVLNKGSLLWKFYRYDKVEKIPPNDPRISNASDGTDICLDKIVSTFEFRATRAEQDFHLEVFLSNPAQGVDPEKGDYKCGATHEAKTQNWCDMTQVIQVQYGPTDAEMTVRQEPESDIYEGDSVVFTCRTEGVPIPDIRWTKVDKAHQETTIMTVSGQQETKLRVTNVKFDKDDGDYRCIATNFVNGTKRMASIVFTLFIEDDELTLPEIIVISSVGVAAALVILSICLTIWKRAKKPRARDKMESVSDVTSRVSFTTQLSSVIERS